MATMRAAASVACQDRPQSTSSSTDPNGPGCFTCSANQLRTSAANASSEAVKVRSTTLS